MDCIDVNTRTLNEGNGHPWLRTLSDEHGRIAQLSYLATQWALTLLKVFDIRTLDAAHEIVHGFIISKPNGDTRSIGPQECFASWLWKTRLRLDFHARDKRAWRAADFLRYPGGC